MEGIVLIKNGTLVTGQGSRRANILIDNALISKISTDIEIPDGCIVVDASEKIVCQGFADIHVHLREPGFSAKETIKTGTLAAAAGGYTTVCSMPNLNPVPDSPENLKIEQDIINRDAAINVLPYCSITKGREGKELVDMRTLKSHCVAFSDDGSGVQDEKMMQAAMQAAAREDCIIAAHCEDNSLLKGGYIHDGKWCADHGHRGICSESEWGQIARDLKLCASTGCRYHVCHISTAESVELIRKAKAEGINVSCETAPHYLALCEDDMQESGRFKMNPPLRSARDREALIDGLLDGTIDAIATDHAPHTAEEKSRGLQGSAMGVTGLETAFPILYTTLVESGIMSLEKLIHLLTDGPRNAFRIDGRMREGDPADITIIDLNSQYRIDSSKFLSMGKSTPFDGMDVRGRISATFINGKKVR